MSDSRLEKFIYAICSMDVSDLPVPLSRIEKLWNCLITGETPDFEPLSRNEKYLMAMLDRYDISNLPAPMSRGEKLLYKIAVGETDLSDVPGYLSRYEELLKYLIENGGISEGDFEYVLYTLNQSMYTLYTTAEKPVKSAILKGRTEITGYSYNGYMLNNHSILSATGEITTMGANGWSTTDSLIKLESGEYYIEDDGTSGDGYTYVYFYTENGVYLNSKSRIDVGVANRFNIDELSYVKLSRRKTPVNKLKIYRKEDLKLSSVKMPVLSTVGKNLFDINNVIQQDDIIVNGNSILISENKDYPDNIIYTFENAPTESVLSFELSSNDVQNPGGALASVWYEDGTNIWITTTRKVYANTKKITDIKIHNRCKGTHIFSNIQLEEGTQVSSYEPFKSNILSTPSDLELRGIGDVQDRLDCLTGELTQRIGEVVLDGSEKWNIISSEDGVNTSLYRVDKIIANDLAKVTWGVDHGVSLPIPYRWNTYNNDEEGIVFTHPNGHCYVRSTIRNLSDFTQWLMANPITIQYELATESIKTVDLTVVDQDNQSTKLGTFENITHVSLEAENLIPEVEMEVATRISTELASASPLMDDISTEQQQLETTVDEQSNNVDATMIATTEIYEETL